MTTDTDMTEAETEQMAKQLGWKPKEEFAGDPERWSDAKTFVENGMNHLPILRENIKKLSSRFDDVSNKYGQTAAELAAVRGQLSEVTPVITELRDRAVRADQAGYERAVAEINSRQREAVETADTAAYDAAQRDRAALEKNKPAAEPAKPNGNGAATVQPNPDLQYIQTWMGSEERSWYRADPELQAAAEAAHASLRRSKPSLTIQENLAETERIVRKNNPEKFGEPTGQQRQQPVSQVESPRGAAPKKEGERSFSHLPPEAKAAFHKYKGMIDKLPGSKPYTEAEYLATYDGEFVQ